MCTSSRVDRTSVPDPYHPIIDRPHEYEIVEFTYITAQNGGQPYIDLVLMKGERTRRLRFHGPQELQITKGFPNSSGLVILDVSARQLDGLSVRVINREAHGGCPEFWAQDVVERVWESL